MVAQLLLLVPSKSLKKEEKILGVMCVDSVILQEGNNSNILVSSGD